MSRSSLHQGQPGVPCLLKIRLVINKIKNRKNIRSKIVQNKTDNIQKLKTGIRMATREKKQKISITDTKKFFKEYFFKFLLHFYLFILYLCEVRKHKCPRVCGGQRITSRNRFSFFPPCVPGWNSSPQAWRQASLHT